MKTKFGLAVLLGMLAVVPAQAVTVYYQPTPFPLYKCTSLPGCPGGSMPQDINIVHIWDGWLSTSYNQTFVRDSKLQIGGWGDNYRTYWRIDTEGLPSNVSSAYIGLYAYPRGDSSTLVNFDMWRVTSSWPLSMTWGTQPGTTYIGSWAYGSNNSFWWLNSTSLYNGWRNGSFPNYGIALMSWTQNNQFDVWRSSRYPYTINDGQRPILYLDFAQPPGMPNFKLPLLGSARWLLTNEVGGYECMGENPWPDLAHQGNSYFSIDLSPTNVKAGGGSYTGAIPILAAASGIVAYVETNRDVPNGYNIVLNHSGSSSTSNGYTTKYIHRDDKPRRKNGALLAVGNSVLLGRPDRNNGQYRISHHWQASSLRHVP